MKKQAVQKRGKAVAGYRKVLNVGKKPRLRGSTSEFSAQVDPQVETYVCANVDPGQLRWFRSFLHRHGLKVHQSHLHTYSFFVPFPRMDRRWHELYRELYEAKIDMIGDLD